MDEASNSLDEGGDTLAGIRIYSRPADPELPSIIPPHLLMIEIMKRSCWDLEEECDWIRLDAAEWILSSDNEPYSFSHICCELELSAKVISRMLESAQKVVEKFTPFECILAERIKTGYIAHWEYECKRARGEYPQFVARPNTRRRKKQLLKDYPSLVL